VSFSVYSLSVRLFGPRFGGPGGELFFGHGLWVGGGCVLGGAWIPPCRIHFFGRHLKCSPSKIITTLPKEEIRLPEEISLSVVPLPAAISNRLCLPPSDRDPRPVLDPLRIQFPARFPSTQVAEVSCQTNGPQGSSFAVKSSSSSEFCHFLKL